MTRVEAIEKEVETLSQDELKEFRRWFAEFDADAWDRQIEEDVRADRLDEALDEAARAFEAGECTDL